MIKSRTFTRNKYLSSAFWERFFYRIWFYDKYQA